VRWHEIRNRAGYAHRMVINYVTPMQQGDHDKIRNITVVGSPPRCRSAATT
jgi:hypothetical protein